MSIIGRNTNGDKIKGPTTSIHTTFKSDAAGPSFIPKKVGPRSDSLSAEFKALTYRLLDTSFPSSYRPKSGVWRKVRRYFFRSFS